MKKYLTHEEARFLINHAKTNQNDEWLSGWDSGRAYGRFCEQQDVSKEKQISTNNSKTDTHIYNIVKNPPKEFTEPCECCGVSEFQLGVKHAEERIIKLLDTVEGHEAMMIAYEGEPEMKTLVKLIKGESNEI
jgi:hypothetical protein